MELRNRNLKELSEMSMSLVAMIVEYFISGKKIGRLALKINID